MSDFSFLQAFWSDSAKTLDFAEKYVYSAHASSTKINLACLLN